MFFPDMPINKPMLNDCRSEHEAVGAGFLGYRISRYTIRELARARDPTKYKLGKLPSRKPETRPSMTATGLPGICHAVEAL